MQRKFFRYFIVSFGLLLLISFLSSYSNLTPVSDTHNNKNQIIDHITEKNPPRVPKGASSEPNGKPLIINQYANISNTFTDVSSNENVSFPILPGWTSKNATINYEGVSRQKQWITNGEFIDDASRWTYLEEDTGYNFWNDGDGHVDWDVGGHLGSVRLGISGGNDFAKDDYAGYQQNVSITGEALSSKIAVVSFEYY